MHINTRQQIKGIDIQSRCCPSILRITILVSKVDYGNKISATAVRFINSMIGRKTDNALIGMSKRQINRETDISRQLLLQEELMFRSYVMSGEKVNLTRILFLS